MFNFIKEFKIFEEFKFTSNDNSTNINSTTNNSTTIIYNFPNNTNINTKKYYSFNRKRALSITSIISIIEVTYFFYLLKKPLIEVVPLQLFENLDIKFNLDFLRYILFILFIIMIFRFNKSILNDNFSKINLISYLIAYLLVSILIFIFISNLFTLYFPLKI